LSEPEALAALRERSAVKGVLVGGRFVKDSAGRRTLLTAELQRDICAFIRAGAYDYAAAEACGISRRAFFEWLERGEGESKRGRAPIYVQFTRAIRRAQAEARVSAEVTVKKIDPKWWLSRMHRERPDAPEHLSELPARRIHLRPGFAAADEGVRAGRRRLGALVF